MSRKPIQLSWRHALAALALLSLLAGCSMMGGKKSIQLSLEASAIGSSLLSGLVFTSVAVATGLFNWQSSVSVVPSTTVTVRTSCTSFSSKPVYEG